MFPFPPAPLVLVTTILFHASISLTFWDSECENIQHLSFSVWLISLSIMSPRFTHVVANGRAPFFHMAKWYCIVYVSLCVLSHSGVLDSLQPHGLYLARVLCTWDFPGKNTEVDCHFLLQWIFQTQGSNLGLPHCRQILLLSEPPGKAL